MKNDIRSIATRMNRRAAELGLVTKEGKPIAVDVMEELLAAGEGYRNAHAYRAAQEKREAPVLALEHPDEAGSDYKLVEGKGCWISMGIFSVHPYLADEGMVVDVYAKGAENESIASTYAFRTEAEAAFCEDQDLDIEDVSDWAKTQGISNFDALDSLKRMSLIRTFRDEGRSRAADTSAAAEGTYLRAAFEVTPDDLAVVLGNHGILVTMDSPQLNEIWGKIDAGKAAKAALSADVLNGDDEETLSSQTDAAHENIRMQLTQLGVLPSANDAPGSVSAPASK